MFCIAACVQVVVTGAVFAAYAFSTNRGPSDEFGGGFLVAMGLIGGWFVGRQWSSARGPET